MIFAHDQIESFADMLFNNQSNLYNFRWCFVIFFKQKMLLHLLVRHLWLIKEN